jgi:hypothetical protein
MRRNGVIWIMGNILTYNVNGLANQYSLNAENLLRNLNWGIILPLLILKPRISSVFVNRRIFLPKMAMGTKAIRRK